MKALITAARHSPARLAPLHCPLPRAGSTLILAVSLGGHAFLFFPVALLTDQGPSHTVTPGPFPWPAPCNSNTGCTLCPLG